MNRWQTCQDAPVSFQDEVAQRRAEAAAADRSGQVRNVAHEEAFRQELRELGREIAATLFELGMEPQLQHYMDWRDEWRLFRARKRVVFPVTGTVKGWAFVCDSQVKMPELHWSGFFIDVDGIWRPLGVLAEGRELSGQSYGDQTSLRLVITNDSAATLRKVGREPIEISGGTSGRMPLRRFMTQEIARHSASQPIVIDLDYLGTARDL